MTGSSHLKFVVQKRGIPLLTSFPRLFPLGTKLSNFTILKNRRLILTARLRAVSLCSKICKLEYLSSEVSRVARAQVDLSTIAQFFSRAQSASAGFFFCSLRQKRELGPTTGTGNEKRRTLRKSRACLGSEKARVAKARIRAKRELARLCCSNILAYSFWSKRWRS